MLAEHVKAEHVKAPLHPTRHNGGTHTEISGGRERRQGGRAGHQKRGGGRRPTRLTACASLNQNVPKGET